MPWLVMAAASIVIPWALYLTAGGYSLPDALAPYALWSALWPIAVGAVLAIGLARWKLLLPQIPEGEVSSLRWRPPCARPPPPAQASAA